MQLNDAQSILDAGRALGPIRTDHNGIPFIVVPESYRVHDLEKLLPKPTRKRSKISLTTADSFVRYVKLHKTPGTIIVLNAGDNGITAHAVIDYHSASEPGHADHHAYFNTAATVEWKRFISKSGSPMNQLDFAAHIENCQSFIVDPPGADLFEMVQTLEGKNNVTFDSVTRLSNGKTALQYEENVALRGTAGAEKGKMDFPSEIVVGIAPFDGCAKYSVKARLRYRIGTNKQLAIWYDVIDQHLVVKDAINDITKQIMERTEIEPLIGTV